MEEDAGLRRRVLTSEGAPEQNDGKPAAHAREVVGPATGDATHEGVEREGDWNQEEGGKGGAVVESDCDTDSLHSESSLIAVSLHKLEAKISETVGELGEKMGHIEAKLELKVEETKAKIEKVAHWAWNSLSFDNLPQWMQENEFLTHSYRPPMNSFRGCFKSMFRMHTETWNIWTHFIGFVFFVALCLGIYVYGDYITFLFEDVEIYQLPVIEQAMLFCFFLGAIICLSCSTMFHLFSSHSQFVYQIFSKLDYSGIALLITGSSIPAYYFGFYCHMLAQCTHISIVTTLGIACMVVSLWRKFSLPEYRGLRCATFVLFGLYGVIPSVHVILKEGFNGHVNQTLTGLVTMAGVYLLGAMLYVYRVPERFFPGKFNTWASSHQLFHVCVLCAALVHYNTLLNMIKYHMSEDSSCMSKVNLQTLEVPVL